MVDARFFTHQGSIPLIELLDGLDVDIPEGNFGDIQINNAAPFDQAGAATISYVHGKSAAKLVRDCKAEVCLMTADVAASLDASNVILPLISKYPQADFAHILKRLYTPLQLHQTSKESFPDVTIAPNVFIGVGAEIGAGTIISPNSVIGPGVTIGENCSIGANVVVEFAQIGAFSKISHGAVIGSSGFGVAISDNGGVDIPHVGTVSIGEHVTLGANVTIDRSMFGTTKIGAGTKIDNLVQIAHNVEIGENCMIAAQVGIAGSTKVGKGVMMGGQAGVSDHIIIGDGAVLSGGSSTMHNIPAGEVWSGIPAMPIRQHMRQLGAIRKLVAKKPKKTT